MGCRDSDIGDRPAANWRIPFERLALPFSTPCISVTSGSVPSLGADSRSQFVGSPNDMRGFLLLHIRQLRQCRTRPDTTALDAHVIHPIPFGGPSGHTRNYAKAISDYSYPRLRDRQA